MAKLAKLLRVGGLPTAGHPILRLSLSLGPQWGTTGMVGLRYGKGKGMLVILSHFIFK